MRRLFTGRWLGYLALTIVFALVCVGLGAWQLSRRAEAAERLARLDNNYASQAVPLTDALPSIGEFDIAREWQPVEMQGRYLADEQLLVRGRPYNGKPGFEVLVPFRLDDGTVFIVNRGWVPVGNNQNSPDAVPAPPSGEVTVVARLKPGEPALIGRSAPAGQLASIQLEAVDALIDAPVYTGAYGLLVEETPGVADRPLPAIKPARDEGPHLSYAFQWFLFALLAFVGLGVAMRQEARAEAGEVPPPRKSKAPTDSEIEDELLDRAAR